VSAGHVFAESEPKGGRQPNIIVILADDLGYGDVGVYGSELIETPHIDALAAAGALVTSGYVAAAVCSPSRAGLLTGRYPQRFGYHFNDNVRPGLPVDQPILASRLKASGYATGIVGKWQLGMDDGRYPLDKGFDEFFGFASRSVFIDPDAPGVENWSPRPIPKQRPPIFRGREVVEEREYLTDALTREAVDFIDRQRDRPFFLYLAHYAPHVPLQATAKYLDRYRHISDPGQRVFAAMVSAVDDSVGAVTARLEALDLAEDTLVFFLSDNGCALYTRGACTNRPLNGGKRYQHEGGVRVPFIVRWPARLAPGTVYDHPVSALDIVPTALAAAGATHAEVALDGVDVSPYLSGEIEAPPHEQLFWRVGPNVAVREGNWKLWRVNIAGDAARELAPGALLTDWVAPDGSPHGQHTLLYDLSDDIGEARNVADRHPAVVERLNGAIERWSAGLPSPSVPSTRGTITEIDGVAVELIF
jgi:arylsulfatase A-like enzyme